MNDKITTTIGIIIKQCILYYINNNIKQYKLDELTNITT